MTNTKKPKKKRVLTSRRKVLGKIAGLKGKQQLSNSERAALICHRAVELHALHAMSYVNIAKKLKEEFNLEATPAITTVCKWMHDGKMVLWHDIKEIQKQLRFDQFNDIEELKARWRDRAMGDVDISRIRTKMINGEAVEIEIIDENAYAEQTKALEAYNKLLARQAALLGLDLAKFDEDKGKTPADLFVWINNIINNQQQPQTHEMKQAGTPGKYGPLELALDEGDPGL